MNRNMRYSRKAWLALGLFMIGVLGLVLSMSLSAQSGPYATSSAVYTGNCNWTVTVDVYNLTPNSTVFASVVTHDTRNCEGAPVGSGWSDWNIGAADANGYKRLSINHVDYGTYTFTLRDEAGNSATTQLVYGAPESTSPTPVNTPVPPQQPQQPVATPVLPAGPTVTPAFPDAPPAGSGACNAKYTSTLQVGNTAEVVNIQAVYAQAGYAADMIGELTYGDVVTLLAGPVCANNTYWWEVQNAQIHGWFLEMTQHGTRHLERVEGVNPGTPPVQPVQPAQPTAQPPVVQTLPTQSPAVLPNSTYCEVRIGVDREAAPAGIRFNFWAESRNCDTRAIRIGTGNQAIAELGSTRVEQVWDSTGRGPGGITFWAIATSGNWETGARAEMNIQIRDTEPLGAAGSDWANNCRQIGCNGEPGGQTNPPANPPQSVCTSAAGLVTGDIVLISDATPNAARLRAGSTTDHAILVEIPIRTALTLIGGPQCGSGHIWWETQYNGYTGWVAEINLIKNGNPLPGGSETQPPVNPPAAGDNTCRHSAVSFPDGLGRVAYGDGIGSALQTQPFGPEVVLLEEGVEFTIEAGPVCDGGLWWWRASSHGYTGWIADGDANGAWVEESGNTSHILHVTIHWDVEYTLEFNPRTCTIINGSEFVTEEIQRITALLSQLSTVEIFGRLASYFSVNIGGIEQFRLLAENELMQQSTCQNILYQYGTSKYTDMSGPGNIIFGYVSTFLPSVFVDQIADIDQFFNDHSRGQYGDNLDDRTQVNTGRSLWRFVEEGYSLNPDLLASVAILVGMY